jgi:hypothetical protein
MHAPAIFRAQVFGENIRDASGVRIACMMLVAIPIALGIPSLCYAQV